MAKYMHRLCLGTSGCKCVAYSALAGLAVLVLVFVFLNQWYGSPLKLLSSSAPGCSGENTTDHIEEDDILAEIQRVLDNNRRILHEDMKDYQYPAGKYNISAEKLEDLAIEEGGNPIRSIILTTWRSGSNFFGGTIGHHPGNFFHFEPLADSGANMLRAEPLSTKAMERVKALINCDYASVKDSLIEYTKEKPHVLRPRPNFFELCETDSVCYDHRYLSALCKLFPFQSVKITRLRLESAQELLADEKLGVRLVLLLRDPRGLYRSRKHVWFCPGSPDCNEPVLICADMVSNYKVAVKLRKKYPNTFRVIRYEDVAADPYKRFQEISEFYGREFHPKVREFLDTHTTTHVDGPFEVYRNTTTVPYKWKTELDFEEVDEIQKSCATAMEYWGYVPAMNATHQREFHPVTHYDLDL